jgi:hypothetical protein
MNDIAVIHTSKGEPILVDADKFKELNKLKWNIDGDGYPGRTFKIRGKDFHERLHRRVLGNPAGKQVDHVKPFRWVNTSWNLRIATSHQNHANQRKQPGRSSRFKGVCWDKWTNSWKAQIQVHERTIHIGRYDSESDAAIAYNNAAMLHFGEFALLNKL